VLYNIRVITTHALYNTVYPGPQVYRSSLDDLIRYTLDLDTPRSILYETLDRKGPQMKRSSTS